MSQPNRLDEYDSAPEPKKSNTGLMIGGCIGCGCLGIIILCVVIGLAISRGCQSFQDSMSETLQQTVCPNNLAQISAALDKYHEKYGSFPPAYTVDENGTPLHSWRVLIVPFLDATDPQSQADYAKIKLDESWDSPHNKQYHSKLPSAFACFQFQNLGNITQGLTSYKMVLGPGTISDGPGCVSKDDIIGNPVIIVEVVPGTNWMCPEEVTLDEAVNGQKVGSQHKDKGYNVLHLDGTVEYITAMEKLTNEQFLIHTDEDE